MLKRLFGLIGYPLGHSFSKQYFTQKFAQAGILDAEYVLFPLPNLSNFPQWINEHPRLCGLNVTLPHKTTVIQYLHVLHESAAAIGAVNCIKISGKQLIGYNTDAFGFEAACPPEFWQEIAENRRMALILGNGGAAKAVEYVLRKWHIPYKIVSRRPAGDHQLAWRELQYLAQESYQLIVNTTPVGMAPDSNAAPDFPFDRLQPDHILYDLVYNPEQTVFLTKGASKGCRTISGLPMLYAQAEKSWQVWENKCNWLGQRF